MNYSAIIEAKLKVRTKVLGKSEPEKRLFMKVGRSSARISATIGRVQSTPDTGDLRGEYRHRSAVTISDS
jgi:hypothetical protein